jgi:2-polyprenyl-6-methoxyphenol hydroxylase-like FAD-dependent oxidoreductase
MGETSAVVIGASIAGLLAASALAGSFERVTVIDRDTLPAESAPRPGVPQSRHVHGLHARGVGGLNELLPGLRDEMLAAGAGTGDAQRDVAWYLEGYRMASAPCGLSGIGLTRRRLEQMIRQRVSQLPGVRIVDATVADSLLVTDGRVTGVRVRPGRARGEDAWDTAADDARDPGDAPGAGPATEEITADLVVDASGRGSRTLTWLEDLGFPQPEISEIRANVVYLSRYYRATPGTLDGLFSVVRVPYPGSPRFGAILRQEDSQWALLLGGMLGDEPPLDDAGMRRYASELGSPEITTLVSSAPPLDDGVRMRFPGNIRRHYEKLDRFPGGLIVTGDALCAFNPVYGQGITVAALEALALRDALSANGKDGLSSRFFRAAGKIVDGAWAMSAGNDLRFPGVEGKRPPGSGLIDAYMTRYRAAMSVDPGLGAAFVRVANSVDSPMKLMTPGAMLRVFRTAGKAAPPAVTPAKAAAASV